MLNDLMPLYNDSFLLLYALQVSRKIHDRILPTFRQVDAEIIFIPDNIL